MKIGFLILSLTQSIPYMNYLVSLGYQVFPIVLRKQFYTANDSQIKSIIQLITNKEILYNTELHNLVKLDCLIIMANNEIVSSLKKLDFQTILKKDAPIVLNICSHKSDEIYQSLTYQNLHFIGNISMNVIDNCNVISSNLQYILTKK